MGEGRLGGHCVRFFRPDSWILNTRVYGGWCAAKVRSGRPRGIWDVQDVLQRPDNHQRSGRGSRPRGVPIGNRPHSQRQRSGVRVVLDRPTPPQHTGALDCVSEPLATSRRFRCVPVPDVYTPAAPALTGDGAVTGARVAPVLDGLKATRGLPQQSVGDNGPALTSTALEQWAMAHGGGVRCIHPGKPNPQAYCEAFNVRWREECVNVHWCSHLLAAPPESAQGRHAFNTERPHAALASQTPHPFAQAYQGRLAA